MISMVVNPLTKTCGSSFHLTFRALPEADNRDVVFGEVINDLVGDMRAVQDLWGLYSEDGRPKKIAIISGCGVLTPEEVS